MAAMTSTVSFRAAAVRPSLVKAGASRVVIRTPCTASPSLARRAQESRKVVVRATPEVEEATSFDADEFFKDISDKWDKLENKSSVAVYGLGAIVTVWLSSTIVSSVNSIPLLPKFLELVGLGYSAWFVYRYLLFKSSREELIADVEELKKKITGATEQ